MKILFFYSVIAFLTTLSGSLLPMLKEEWTKKHLWRLLAFGSGVLLGIAFLKLLPEAFSLAGNTAGLSILTTFVLLFAAENVTMVHTCEEFLEPPKSPLMPISALAALSLHAGIDGMAIGVGLRQNVLLGSVISLGVILHKFSDGLTLTSLLRAAGYSRFMECILAVALAFSTPLGAFASFLWAGPQSSTVIGIVLGVAAGSFIYIGAADLLPRLHDAHDRYCLFFFVLGIVVIGFFA
ncbi:MAG: ZIP family metal transporter [Elusimicrobiota bacterium]|jgi:zinc transporter ZupT